MILSYSEPSLVQYRKWKIKTCGSLRGNASDFVGSCQLIRSFIMNLMLGVFPLLEP